MLRRVFDRAEAPALLDERTRCCGTNTIVPPDINRSRLHSTRFVVQTVQSLFTPDNAQALEEMLVEMHEVMIRHLKNLPDNPT